MESVADRHWAALACLCACQHNHTSLKMHLDDQKTLLYVTCVSGIGSYDWLENANATHHMQCSR